MVAQLSAILNVPPARLLLMREEVELPTDSTISALGLGITDIIGESHDVCDRYIRAGSENIKLCCCCAECVVMAAEDGGEGGGSVTLRLQSKERESSQEFTLHRVCSSSSSSCSSSFSCWLSWQQHANQPHCVCVCVCFRTPHWAPSSPSICPGCPAVTRKVFASTLTAPR